MSKILNKQKLERARSKISRNWNEQKLEQARVGISRKWNEHYLESRVEQDPKEYVYQPIRIQYQIFKEIWYCFSALFYAAFQCGYLTDPTLTKGSLTSYRSTHCTAATCHHQHSILRLSTTKARHTALKTKAGCYTTEELELRRWNVKSRSPPPQMFTFQGLLNVTSWLYS